MKCVFTCTRSGALRQGNLAGAFAATGPEFAHRAEFVAIPETEIAHVAVEAVDPLRVHFVIGSFVGGIRKGGLGTLGADGAHDVDRPGSGVLEAALDGEG